MAWALSGVWPGRVARSAASAAQSWPGDSFGSGGADRCGERDASAVGTQEDRCTAQARGSRAGLAISLDGGCDPCAAWTCQRSQADTAAGLRQWTVARAARAERGVDRG